MENSNFDKVQNLARTIVGAILSISSIFFLWKGVNSIGEIGFDFQWFSGKFSTTSAGFIMLVAGIILLFPQRQTQDNGATEQKNLAQTVIGVLFYIFIGLLPVIGWIGISIYINIYGSKGAQTVWPTTLMYLIIIEIGLFSWVVGQVTNLLRNGDKKINRTT